MARLDVLPCLQGTSRADPRAFCVGCVTRPAPSFASEIYFFRVDAWSGANSNRDLPVCPLSALTPAGVAFFSPAASIRAPGSSQTDVQAESKLLAQAALFAHAWR